MAKPQHFAPFVGGEVEYVVLENRGSGKKNSHDVVTNCFH